MLFVYELGTATKNHLTRFDVCGGKKFKEKSSKFYKIFWLAFNDSFHNFAAEAGDVDA